MATMPDPVDAILRALRKEVHHSEGQLVAAADNRPLRLLYEHHFERAAPDGPSCPCFSSCLLPPLGRLCSRHSRPSCALLGGGPGGRATALPLHDEAMQLAREAVRQRDEARAIAQYGTGRAKR